SELLLCVGVHLGEGQLGVLARDLLVDRTERLARATPLGPEVHQDDVVLGDGLLELGGRDVDGAHTSALLARTGRLSSRLVTPPAYGQPAPATTFRDNPYLWGYGCRA